jgi:YVTN family beta-propeller protein
MKLTFCLTLILASLQIGFAQSYSAANGHSHNDYEQQNPFHQAYNEGFGSIEADIHLKQGEILVGHDAEDLDRTRTFEKLYLQPLLEYKDRSRKLILLIDIKTESLTTLDALISLLKKYPELTSNTALQITISGNKPPKQLFINYPSYIWFDGRTKESYTEDQLKKISLLSENYTLFTKGKKNWPIEEAAMKRVEEAVNKTHAMGKPIRLWNSPDFAKAWETLISLKVDYINTDKINELSDFFVSRNKSIRLLPYNRIIKSAGSVIRYGKPNLENHALDVASLDNKGLVVVEERYGLFVIDINQQKILKEWRFSEMPKYAKYMSSYSGIKTFDENGKTYIVWGAAEKDGDKSAIMIAEWDNGITNISHIAFEKTEPAKNAIVNEIAVSKEPSGIKLYAVLNGNNKLQKINWGDKTTEWIANTGVAPYGVSIANGAVYVSNWAGETAIDSTRERAGVPWGLAYTDPKTGATASGTVSIFNINDGSLIKELKVGLHPTAIKSSSDEKYVYVANGSSDEISVINTKSNEVAETIFVGMTRKGQIFQGSTPNGLELNKENTILYVANGMDNALAVVHLGKNATTHGKGISQVSGHIPTEAYPAGLKLINNILVVANLESDGANVIDSKKNARSIHHELASVSIIPEPDGIQLERYSMEVSQLNLMNRMDMLGLTPRADAKPVPVPERLGEPSLFKHVVYIIKENKTYDQVLGDMKEGRGDSSLCVFGEKITPNTHSLARQFGWMDDYHASGKSSAEGHQWTDAGMTSDYVEKNVRAWFRSYPHRQDDALVYNKSGFIWNQALDHGKTVRVYGEACETEYDRNLSWIDLYKQYKAGIAPNWYNKTTIGRLNPIIHPTMPDCDNLVFSDQQRADIFIEDWKRYEGADSLPNLMVLSLPNDHAAGTSPEFPTPDAMVADNDLALGRIIEMITNSKSWDSTVIFVTQDDSQSGWDHISAYRTVGFIVSPYSTGKLNSTHYNQISMLRTIEQILGIPPMNIMDATSRIMTDCFQAEHNNKRFTTIQNNIPLDQMNKPMSSLRGREKKMAELSENELFNQVDGGKDDQMNRIIWYYTKGNKKYPRISR